MRCLGPLQFPRWSLCCSGCPAAADPCTPMSWWCWSLPACGPDSYAGPDHGCRAWRKNDHVLFFLPGWIWLSSNLAVVTTPSLPLPLSLHRPVCRATARSPAAVQPQQLGASARRLLPHQRQSRRALHVVNYVTEHAPVAYKDLTVGEYCSHGRQQPFPPLPSVVLSAAGRPLTCLPAPAQQVCPRRWTTLRSVWP
jgi:hypothetical protein